jgi:hypothetical protein
VAAAYAAQVGCASRATATIPRTSSVPSSGTVAMSSPVAGFMTGIPAAWVGASVAGPTDIATASL